MHGTCRPTAVTPTTCFSGKSVIVKVVILKEHLPNKKFYPKGSVFILE